jgi:hypothetical protein
VGFSDAAAAEPVRQADLLYPASALDESQCTRHRKLVFACGENVLEQTMGSITAGLEYLVAWLSVGPVLLALIMLLFLPNGAAKRS